MMRRHLTGLLLLVMLVPLAQAQFLHTSGTAIVNDAGDTVVLKGMGLGGWMLQEGYMLQTTGFANAQYEIRSAIEALIGSQDTEEFYDAWLANHVRKIDIDSLAAWGFNSVRLPMHYNLFTLPIEEEPVAGQHTWLEKGFALTDSLISWCAQNEMYVVLDLHAAPGGQGYESGISDYNPDKPSLWESEANKQKTVALWRKLAERYVDQPWVAGYDLINEPNWNLPGNTALRNLYEQITAAIRSVDDRHIIFIEGNWFANDFTGLTPPWDDNMVYSPHKYWSFNTPGSIQWVLSIRDAFQVPLYFGEWGENSNSWFTDVVRLFNEHGLSWACWPMKKIESISGPLSIRKSAGYQHLLDYWNGQASAPSQQVAINTLMQLTEDLKLERCAFQRDVIDAMFRQINETTARPYREWSVPGVIHAADFDLGPHEVAYFDRDIATYHVSTGNYTAWNQGWSYRNDGVDIEPCLDTINTNGYNLGWLEDGEWTQYTIKADVAGVYDIVCRTASEAGGGAFQLSLDGADVTGRVSVPATGGWQEWTSVWIENVVLSDADRQLRMHVDRSGFNLNSFELIYRQPSDAVPTTHVSAHTVSENTVRLNINKRLIGPLQSAAGFQIMVNGSPVDITGVALDSESGRQTTFTVDDLFKASDTILLSYSSDGVLAVDSTHLEPFSDLAVENTIAIVHTVPGRIEAEDYFFQSGIVLEATSDAGGGQNIGHLDAGDYGDYLVHVPESRSYRIDYRTAALSAEGRIVLQLINENGSASALHAVSFPATGGWQTWTTTSKSVILSEGLHTLRVLIDEPQFNLNWFEISFTTAASNPLTEPIFHIAPNPVSDRVWITGGAHVLNEARATVRHISGMTVIDEEVNTGEGNAAVLDLTGLPVGIYILTLKNASGVLGSRKLVKTSARE